MRIISLVCLAHAHTPESAEICDRVFHALGDQSVAAVKLLARSVYISKPRMPASTAIAILAAQEDLAPSQTMPDVTASAFTIVWEISRQPPP